MQPIDNVMFLEKMQKMVFTVNRLESHGGKVIFIRMPTSDLIRQIRNKRYPQDRFWTYMEKEFPGKTINADTNPIMNRLHCPDGSHLDKKDRQIFTVALAQELRSRGVGVL